MYWSGRVTPLVYEFSADGRRHITIRDYLPGTEAGLHLMHIHGCIEYPSSIGDGIHVCTFA